ncbi:class II aldolase/adducin family protein [Streptomyces acidiscabies]|uniref:Class II aldolase/adducin family protein n=1 Tax=Streptomyces acidiscabies TaxID=42234 RepID=A0AAP6BLN1_9ACTN|nr:class II aldolase/adducin family protein [Streptomyces acidiscabies]MBP5942121.1 class II aldolase/adducin family protein [Streptomyces sp. LBUM 1476]MBZ3913631.1 class II aldolase/adducin family protein [Streptomyces acidiscabies]MDX2967094.1 class II aldolase/adducin family protein [Streptomyces acidiscabies]MDX3023200.1 class II aldolase/adducin family protein [Streptomyces acidiscabies]MDX3792654.1 class II aldolase/adducin family protein [Streptomyces acidiscabies]
MTVTPAAVPHASVGSMPEGVQLPLPQQNLSVEEEREIRKRELAAAFRLFARFGFSEGVAGHITARDPGNPSAFWVNPFGMSFSQIRVSDLILVDHDGTLLEGRRPVNNAAFCIHSEVHRARPDVVAAAHTHSLHGKAFSSLGIPLEPITQDSCAFFEDHGIYSDYRGVVNDTEEGRRIGVALDGGKAVVLQNHGLLTVGESVAEAAWYFITMERSCQAQLLAMAAGKPKLIDAETARTVRAQISGALPGWFQFRPLWDQITEEQPDLFD